MVVGNEEVTLLNDNLYSKVRSTLGYSGWFEDAMKDADFAKLAVSRSGASARLHPTPACWCC